MEDNFVLWCMSFGYGILLGCILDIYLFHYSMKVCHYYSIPKSSLSLLWYRKFRILHDIIFGRNCVEFIKNQTIFFPCIELLMGFLLALNFYYYQINFEFFSNIIFIILLFAISIICNRTMYIPNEISYPGIIIGLLFSFMKGGITPLDSILGLLVGGGSMYLIFIIGRLALREEAIGIGCIKVSAMIGTFLGWERTLLALFFTFMLGSIVAIFLLVTKKKKRSDKISLGEFQGIGAITSLLWGNQIIFWYLLRLTP